MVPLPCLWEKNSSGGAGGSPGVGALCRINCVSLSHQMDLL